MGRGYREMENVKMHIIIDIEKCVGCYNCVIACKDEHSGNSWLPYTDEQQKHDQKWIEVQRHERGTAPYSEVCYIPKLCNHCGNAQCMNARPDAVNRRGDGVVMLDAAKSKGDKALVDACPYGMISWNEEFGTAQKCTMCAHLLDNGWAEPRCVQACPLRAISVMNCGDAAFESAANEQGLEALTDAGSAPRVMYRNLYKRNTCFIAGALAYQDGGTEKVAPGAKVRLLMSGQVVAEATTDFFGEFKIDRVPKNSGAYKLEYTLAGFRPCGCEVTVGEESPCLEVMMLTRE